VELLVLVFYGVIGDAAIDIVTINADAHIFTLDTVRGLKDRERAIAIIEIL
jgi:hypothetical protein